MSVPDVRLNNAVTIPQLGFGVFQIEPEETRDATLTALEVGYRHIDTAQLYGNEVGVGEAVRDSGLARDEVFVTSKLHIGRHGDPVAAFGESLDSLGFEYLDLYLIHWPQPWIDVDYVDVWKGLEEVYASGRVRAIGVSNFHENHLTRLLENTDVVPAVNQIEVHPYLTQDSLRAFNASHGIATEAWSPIAQGKALTDPVVVAIAEAHGRTPAQVALRWHLQRGEIIFPKSLTRSRVEENFAVFDFELSDDEIARISALDADLRVLGLHPDEKPAWA